MIVNGTSISAAYGKGVSAQATAVQNGNDSTGAASPAKANGKLTQQQQSEVQKLKKTDQDVRKHEQAHLSAAGGIAVSGINYKYTTGPDSKSYATGGDVSVDTSPVPNDPAATLRKAETIRRAALAPSDPSAQDYSVAAQAEQMANKARMQLLQAQQQSSASGSLLNVRA